MRFSVRSRRKGCLAAIKLMTKRAIITAIVVIMAFDLFMAYRLALVSSIFKLMNRKKPIIER